MMCPARGVLYRVIPLLLAVTSVRWTLLCDATSVRFPGTATCDVKNRDPCSTFPDLCSTGGGLCVLKGPCEYECVCPPDGRRGRDCTGRDDTQQTPMVEVNETPKRESLLNSLLVFPQDLFWDLNHVLRPEDSVKMIQATLSTVPTTTLVTRTTPQMSKSRSLLTYIVTTTPPQRREIPLDVSTQSSPVMISRVSSTQNHNHVSGLSATAAQTTTMATTSNGTSSDTPSVSTSTTTNPPSNKTMLGLDGGVGLSTSDKQTVRSGENDVSQMTSGVQESVGDEKLLRSFSSEESKSSGSETLQSTSNPVARATSNSDQTLSSPMTSAPYLSPTNSSLTNDTITQTTLAPATTTAAAANNLHNQSSSLPVYNDTTEGITSRSENMTQSDSAPTVAPIPTEGGIANAMDTSGLQSVPELDSAQEHFPGHAGFPTFFSDVVNDRNQERDPLDVAMSKGVHRVFHPIPAFEKIERRWN